MSSTDQDLSRSEVSVVQRYLDARDEVDRLEAELKKAKERRDKAETKVLDLYVEQGWQNVKCNGRTVSLVRKQYARPVPGEREALIAAMRDYGYGDLVKIDVNPSTLSSLVREHTAENDPLPEEITKHIIVAEVFGVSLRRG